MAAELGLIDHHVHGVVPAALDRKTFEHLISESGYETPQGTSRFDAPVGLAIRRWCAPLLDLEPFAAPDDYLSRRADLGVEEVHRRFLGAARCDVWIVDTGYLQDELSPPWQMEELSGSRAYEVVRIETVAEEAAMSGVNASDYPDVFEHLLEEKTHGAVALKTIVAYRGGLAFDPSPPRREDVVDAVGRWQASRDSRVREVDVLRFGLWTAVELARHRRLPLQVHTGFGDSEVTLHLANPTLLTEWLRQVEPLGVPVTLLHCYPYHREAAYLAHVFPHVFFDVGLAMNYGGTSSRDILAAALEVAPFTKHLYSSDALGLAELHFLSATLFRAGIEAVLAEWVDREECTVADASRIARLIGVENALRIYDCQEST